MIRFDEREMRLIANCDQYAQGDPAGLPGHALMVLVHKLASLMEGPPICTECWAEMTRAHYQDGEGHWFVCWLCDCEPDAKVLEQGET